MGEPRSSSQREQSSSEPILPTQPVIQKLPPCMLAEHSFPLPIHMLIISTAAELVAHPKITLLAGRPVTVWSRTLLVSVVTLASVSCTDRSVFGPVSPPEALHELR